MLLNECLAQFGQGWLFCANKTQSHSLTPLCPYHRKHSRSAIYIWCKQHGVVCTSLVIIERSFVAITCTAIVPDRCHPETITIDAIQWYVQYSTLQSTLQQGFRYRVFAGYQVT
ncbi:hypothetical protein TNCV_2165521 [Trichonephila clavipes]|nr:hypothetical protein TNCV_2165521 [Trichonephila clavipes]